MNNGHNLSYERSSGYGGYRCSDCGEWFYQQAVNWNDLKPCPVLKQEHSVTPSEHSVATMECREDTYGYAMKVLTKTYPTHFIKMHDFGKRGLKSPMKTIFSPSHIEIGKRYVNSLCYGTVYLGCENYDTKEKFLVIIKGNNSEFIARTASNKANTPLWTMGFQQQ